MRELNQLRAPGRSAGCMAKGKNGLPYPEPRNPSASSLQPLIASESATKAPDTPSVSSPITITWLRVQRTNHEDSLEALSQHASSRRRAGMTRIVAACAFKRSTIICLRFRR